METQEIENILQEYLEKTNRSMRELEILKQISTDNLMAVLELRKSQELLSREFRSFKDEMKVFKDEMKAFKDEMKAFKDEMNKKWGELANRLGTITEDIFAPGIPHLVKSLGYTIKEKMLNVEFGKNGRFRQYDALVMAEDENGNEVLFVAEVKSRARSEDFEQLKDLLKDLLEFKPTYQKVKIVPVLAAFKIPEDLVNLASKKGVLLVRMGGEYLEPLNPEVVK